MDEEAALEAGWQFLCRKQGDIPFSTVVACVRACCPSVDEKRIRAEFTRRLRGWCGSVVEESERRSAATAQLVETSAS